jgi:hypothetical protein
MLVGYPVDGSQFGDASIVPGAMYQSQPQPYPLSLATDPVANQQVYTATWLLSYPGNSGGPFYVQYNGYYYPAGVYLGTLYNGTVPYASLVRGIDSNVVNLIKQAASLGDAGTNNTGGGVITIIPSQSLSAIHPAYVQVQLGPALVMQGGAGWRLHGDPAYGSAVNYTRAVTTNGATIEFKPVNGWDSPTNQAVGLAVDQLNMVSNAFYTFHPPVLTLGPASGLGISGPTGATYRLEYRPALSQGQWVALQTNTLGPGVNRLLSWPPTNGSAGFYRAVWLP